MMPRRPKQPCAIPGCPEIVNAGERYCKKHKCQEQRRYDNERGTAAQRGYGSRWRRYTLWFKKRYPLCAECERQGGVTPTYVVDHIEPVTGPDDPLFWDLKNHQPLCERCHNVKRATEDKKTWRRRRGG